MNGRALLAILAAMLTVSTAAAQQAEIVVGSKRFTESYVLGEIVRQTLAREGIRARHEAGLGNTAILHQALLTGAIDVYPEYIGTIARELLKRPDASSIEAINAALVRERLAVSVPLGFENGYALALREEEAARRGVSRLSDLTEHRSLRFGLSHEFLARADGWPALASAYRLGVRPIGLDHGLAYEALAAGRVDVIDVYTTDAKLARYRLRVLEDDQRVFPKYDAVLFHRIDLQTRSPQGWKALIVLANTIDAKRMIALNAMVELDRLSFADAASRYFGETENVERRALGKLLTDRDFFRLTSQHLVLTFVSVAAAIVVGVPLGVAAWRYPRLGTILLGAVSVVQTIPSLALLAFLIAATGAIGFWPALAALFLYGLLPIVANTHAALAAMPQGLMQAAIALGLPARHRLLKIQLPLAWPTILTGVQTSAVINVGTATIAAFIGAGGYGERIASGLATNDATMLLAGAIPAAVLALAVQGLFTLLRARIAWLRYR